MSSTEAIERFLALRHLAVVGVSEDPKAFPNVVYRRLREGRTLYPVNQRATGTTLEGDPAHRRLAEVPDPVDGVLVLVAAERAEAVVVEAIERGIRHVWLHRGAGTGAVSDAAVARCREHGVEVVEGACPLMFVDPVRGVHRLHRLLAGRRLAA